MKKLILTFSLFVSLIFTCAAPPIDRPTMYIMPVNPIIKIDTGCYAKLVDAMFTHEASRDTLAVNVKEQAYGGLQIRSCRLNHYNELNNTNYTLEDCFDFEISKKIFMYFTNHDSRGRKIPNKTLEQAAKDWNGSGYKTIAYWEKVRSILIKNA